MLTRRIEGATSETADAEDRSRRLDSDAEAVQVLTIHRAKGLEVLEPGYPIQPEDLDAACDIGNIAVESGDIVLVRTGQMTHLKPPSRDLMKYVFPTPGAAPR